MLAAANITMQSVIALAVLGYCLISIVILAAYARTRLYPLYLLKIAWVAFTIIGFVWIIAMSFGDPGSEHGGVASEFMVNPAGPYSAVANYPMWTARIYGSSPWWLLALTGLLIVWRGLVGHPQSAEDSPVRRRFVSVFLPVSVVAAAATVLFVDNAYLLAGKGALLAGLLDRAWQRPARWTDFMGTLGLLVACGVWARIPLRWRRKASAAVLGVLLAAVAAPLVVCFVKFDWSPYTYAAANYTFAWKTAYMGKYMLNSLLVSVLTVGITTLLASMAAYALARFEFVGRNVVLFAFIGAMVIPAQLYIVPLFLTVKDWQATFGGLQLSFMDTRFALSLIYAAAGLPFAIFLLTGFYRTLPGALREAAAIDGCGEWRMFTDVYFPLAAPGMATAAIFQFLGVWNEYQFALVFLTNDKLKTLPVGLYNLSVSQQYAANWSALFAGVTILCLPTFLIFVILQERIVAGLTVGAIKE